ncbi:MAG: thiol-disulfide oxidoreductase DCC family protein [Hyphomicrobiaceae bacterium]
MTIAKLTVYYDGSCPLCRREIAFYKNQEGSENIVWSDVSACAPGEVVPGLDRAVALKRFHVATEDGKLESGSLAFARLWIALPRFVSVGRMITRPGVRHLAEFGYQCLLNMRPTLQWIFQFFDRNLEGPESRRNL